MNWVQLIFSSALLIVGGVFIAFNAMIFWFTVIRKEDASSVAPIVGGIIAAACGIALPVTSSWHWAWRPLMVDWGRLSHLLVPLVIREGRVVSAPNKALQLTADPLRGPSAAELGR